MNGQQRKWGACAFIDQNIKKNNNKHSLLVGQKRLERQTKQIIPLIPSRQNIDSCRHYAEQKVLQKYFRLMVLQHSLQ